MNVGGGKRARLGEWGETGLVAVTSPVSAGRSLECAGDLSQRSTVSVGDRRCV
jgi:hypothetical protein